MSTYHATKYDSARDEVVAILADANEGFGTEHFGDVEAPCGYVQTVGLDDSHDLDFSDHTNYPVGDQAGEVARTYGVTADDVKGLHIVVTNSQGFVDVESYALEDEEAFEARVQAYRDSWGEWDDQD